MAPSGQAQGQGADLAAVVQQAVEQFVERHSAGEAPDLLQFAAGFPEPVRPQILEQCRQFLAFDGFVGHQEWDAAAAATPAGRQFGDFVIQEELGRGGMGIVYLAHQKSLNRRVALKVMAAGLTLSRRHVERFRREATAAAQLRHPGIVPVHSFTEVDGTFAFAMDFIAGRNLGDILDDLRLANGPEPTAVEGSLGVQPEKGYVAECALVCAQLASALAAAHKAGIAHRDLKPRNVMLDENRQARLLDFGLAKGLDQGSISVSGEITGTAHYMSPEQTLAKRVPLDHRTDVFSLGVILYELLTLRRPFDGRNLQQIVYEICFKEPVPLPRLNRKVPSDLVTICAKALEKDPQNRYQTAAEFEADLLRFLRWEPIHARPAGPLVRLSKWVQRHRTETATAMLLAVAAAGVAGWTWWRTDRAHRQAEATMAQAEQKAADGEFEAGIDLAHAAQALRPDDPALGARLDRIRFAGQKHLTDIAEAQYLVSRSSQTIQHDREGAIRYALEAVAHHDCLASRSAVLEALGAGYHTTRLRDDAATAGYREFCAHWSGNGRLVATGGSDGRARIWDAGGVLLRPLEGHDQGVLDVAFHPDGALVATAGVDHTARLWRTGDGRELVRLPHPGTVEMVQFDQKGERLLTTAYAEGGRFTAHVWAIAGGAATPLCSIDTNHQYMRPALSPDGRWVASWSGNGVVRVFDAATGTERARLDGHGDAVRRIAFSPASDLVATACADGCARVFALPDGRLLRTVRHARQVDDVAFDPEGQRLLTAARDSTARVWLLCLGGDVAVEQQALVGHGGELLTAAFDGSGKYAVTAAKDGVVRVFDTAAGSERTRYEAGPGIHGAAFDPSGRRILIQTQTGSLLWDFADTRAVVIMDQPGPVHGACFDRRGDRVVTTGDDEVVRCWNAHDGSMLWATRKLGNPVLAVDVDPLDERLLVALHDGSVALHRLADGEALLRLAGHRGPVTVARFAAGGSRIVTAGDDHRAVVWNTNTAAIERALERPNRVVTADLSPDGSLLATVDAESTAVQLWRADDGQAQGELRGHTEPIRWLAFRPDGQALLTVGADGKAIVQSLRGEVLHTFDAGVRLVRGAWSRDGQQVLTCSDVRTQGAQLWSLAAGKDAARLVYTAGGAQILCCAFGPDGRWALTTARDGRTHIWPTDPVAVANRLDIRQLTDAERRNSAWNTR